MARRYYQQCAVAWDGDNFGNEWRCGYAAIPGLNDANPTQWEIYEDDGAGNGNFVCTAKDEETAIKVVAALCDHLDNNGLLEHFNYQSAGADPCSVEHS